MGKIASTASAHSDQLRGLQDTVEKMSTTVEATASRVTELESTVSGRSDVISTMEAEMLAVKREVSTLKDRCEDLEARSRNCSVRITGPKEGRENGKRMSDCSTSAERDIGPRQTTALGPSASQSLQQAHR